MGLEDVKQEIIQEAESEADEIRNEAENKADEIIHEAEDEAQRIKDEADEEIEEIKASMEKKAVSNANMEAKKKKLDAKEKALNEAFKEFSESLDELEDEEKEAMIENAVENADFDVGLVRGSEDFEDFVDVDFEASDNDGFVLVSKNSERQLDFSFDKIVEDVRGRHRKEVAERLFG